MAITQQELDFWREKLESSRKKGDLSRKNFSSDVRQELRALEKDLAGYDPDFIAELLRQIAASTVGRDGNAAVRIRYARSIIKTVKSGDPMEMLQVVQMIAVHHASITHAALLEDSQNHPQWESPPNIFNKLCAHIYKSNGYSAAMAFRPGAKAHRKHCFSGRRWSGICRSSHSKRCRQRQSRYH